MWMIYCLPRIVKVLLDDTKTFLQKHFEMKDMGEATYVLGIKIKRDRMRGLLGLSHRAYIDKVLKRFNMSSCGTTEMLKEDL